MKYENIYSLPKDSIPIIVNFLVRRKIIDVLSSDISFWFYLKYN
jgi:hypothetical protein